jgi:hypothetical protein
MIPAFLAACGAEQDAPTAPPSLTVESVARDMPGRSRTATEEAAADTTVDRKVASPPAGDGPKLALDPQGLRWFLPPNGSARPILFGTAQADVLASLERVRGEASKGTNSDCGAGPVQYANWADGLSLVFRDGRFAGWGLDGRAGGAIATSDGIGIGTTRAELDDATGPPLEVRQTSLGTEFSAGAYHGLFGGSAANARITDMWAGVSCVAR